MSCDLFCTEADHQTPCQLDKYTLYRLWAQYNKKKQEFVEIKKKVAVAKAKYDQIGQQQKPLMELHL
jgi:hypothetical protein